MPCCGARWRRPEGGADARGPVIDATALSGNFEWRLTWGLTSDSPYPAIFTAVPEQLGLRLEPRTAPVREHAAACGRASEIVLARQVRPVQSAQFPAGTRVWAPLPPVQDDFDLVDIAWDKFQRQLASCTNRKSRSVSSSMTSR